MKESFENPKGQTEQKDGAWKEKARHMLARRAEILSKLTMEEREELADLEEEIRKLTS